jgi:nucleoside-diphosphate-sugar epimerase
MEVWRAMEEGLPAVIVNPSVIIGEGDWNTGTCRFFKMLRHGFTFYPIGMNGFVSVQDVVQCSIRLMQSDIVNERFILNGENLSYKDFFTCITRTLGVKQPKYPLSPSLISVLRICSDILSTCMGINPFLTRETANTVNHIYRYNNNKITKAIDYKFEPAEVFVTRTALAYKEFLSRHS